MAREVLMLFSPAAEFLAVATPDGRVKTWDVASGLLRGEFVDVNPSTSGAGPLLDEVNGHLGRDYSCIAWSSLPSSSKKSKKKGVGSLLLVLGTGAGDVLAWDTALGELKWRTSDCHSGGVKSIAFSKSGQVLYTAGGDGMICELRCASGEVVGKFRGAKTPVSCLAISPDGNSLLAASSQLKLFDLSSKKTVRKFTGHAAVVNAVVFSEDGEYVLSSAVGERQVAVWQVGGSKAEKEAMFSLSLDRTPVALDCGLFEGDGMNVVALSQSGVAYIWQAALVEELVSVKPMTVNVASSNGVLAARLVLQAGKDSETVLIAHGSTAKPVFEHVSIGAPGSTVVLDAGVGGSLLAPSQQRESVKSAKLPAVTVLGSDNAASAVLTRTHVDPGELPVSGKKKKKRRASVDFDADVQNSLVPQVPKADDEVAEMDEDDGQTMQERLIALGIVDEVPSKENIVTPLVPPKADSLQVLLSQALQADDMALLEQCLAISDEKMITTTVRALQPSEAAKIFSVCIVKLETRPQRGLALVPWVRTVLLQHAAALMSNPAIQPILTSLYQLIEARVSVFRPLLGLSGRLDLIFTQILLKEAQTTYDANAEVLYEEQGSEVEVEEVENDASYADSSDKDADLEDDMLGSEDESELKAQGNGIDHEMSADSGGDSDTPL